MNRSGEVESFPSFNSDLELSVGDEILGHSVDVVGASSEGFEPECAFKSHLKRVVSISDVRSDSRGSQADYRRVVLQHDEVVSSSEESGRLQAESDLEGVGREDRGSFSFGLRDLFHTTQ